MKIFTLIIHENCQEDLSDALKMTDLAQHFIFTEVKGHDGIHAPSEALSMRDQVVGYLQKIKIDILVDDKNIKGLLDVILSVNGIPGQSSYWVTSVEKIAFI